MLYLLFRYSLADQRKLYQEFKSKEELIKFIEGKKDEIEIDKIIEAGREFKINWILKLDEIKKPIKMVKQAKEPEPKIEAKKGRGRPRKEKVSEEKKVGEDIKKKDEATLKRSDEAIEATEKEQGDKEKQWELCTVCEKNKVVSSNKRKICAECLQKEGEKEEIKMGRCKRKSCLKVFELEDWQHSILHWCPECQQRPDYKSYDKNWRKSQA